MIQLDNVTKRFPGGQEAISGLSLSIDKGEMVFVTGHSGAGKSTLLRLIALIERPSDGQVIVDNQNTRRIKRRKIPAYRRQIGMVFQEPMTALNPVHTIGKQLTEVLLLHKDISAQESIRQSVDILDRVGIPSPDIRMTEYPHQLSGGMRQRVVIAMALACKPALLIADEPTTALDVTIQAQILELIKDLQAEMGMTVLLITHDLGVIAETCDDVVVMYAGKVAEKGTVFDLFDRPKHPYTQGLLASIPTLETVPKSKLSIIEGMVPGLLDLPEGCRFQNRCPHQKDECLAAAPEMQIAEPGHEVSCVRWKAL